MDDQNADGEMKQRLLVVDDDKSLNEMVSTAMEFAGYEVASAHDGATGRDLAKNWSPDAIILDVNLPDDDGFSICAQLRADGIETPIIFLTARDQPEDVMEGLRLGGDDYVRKPFQLGELSLRLQAVLRRTSRTDPVELRCGDLLMNDKAHRITWKNEAVQLTPREYSVLRHLLLNRDRVLSKSQIAAAVWGASDVGDDNLIETYVSRLRTKLGDAAVLVETVRGIGYALREPATDGDGSEA